MFVFLGCYNYDGYYVKCSEREESKNLRCFFIIADTERHIISCYKSIEISNFCILIGGNLRIDNLSLNIYGKPYKWPDSIDNSICKTYDNCIRMKDFSYRFDKLLYNLNIYWDKCKITYSETSNESLTLQLCERITNINDLNNFYYALDSFDIESLVITEFFGLDIFDLRNHNVSKIKRIRFCSLSSEKLKIKEIYLGNLNLSILKELSNYANSFDTIALFDFSDCINDLEVGQHCLLSLGIHYYKTNCFVIFNNKSPKFIKRLLSNENNEVEKLCLDNVNKNNIKEVINRLRGKSVLLRKENIKHKYVILS